MMAEMDAIIVAAAAEHAGQMLELRNIHLTRSWIRRQLRDPDLSEEERNDLLKELIELRAKLRKQSDLVIDRLARISSSLRETAETVEE